MNTEGKPSILNDLKILAIKNFFTSKVKHDQSQVGLFEFGIKRCRFDLIIINAQTQKIRGFEFKTNRADFLKDKRESKWKKYLKYCHTFTWVCPPHVIKREDVESPAGLLWVWTEDRREYEMDYRIHWSKSAWKKRPTGTGNIEQSDLNDILILMFSRIKARKEDFF